MTLKLHRGRVGSARRVLALAACAACAVASLAVAGCAAVKTDGDLSAVKATVQGFEVRNAVKVDNTRKIMARDIQENTDKVTMRIIAIGFVLMGLSYPVGKIAWLIAEKSKGIVTTKLATDRMLKKIKRELP